MVLSDRLVEMLGAASVRQLHGGHQSTVFEVIGPGPRMVAKVHDASMIDRFDLEVRVETTAELARPSADDPPLVRGSVRGAPTLISAP